MDDSPSSNGSVANSSASPRDPTVRHEDAGIWANGSTAINRTALCDAARGVTNLPIFVPVLSVGVVISVLAVVPNLLLVWASLRATIFPANLRYLLAHLSLNLAAYSLAYVVKYTTLLSTNTCDLTINAFSCRLRDLGATIPWFNIVYSLAGISWERLYCSIRYRSYDTQSRGYLGVAIILATWTATLGMSTFQLPSLDRGRVIALCDGQFSATGDNYAVPILAADGTLELISMFIVLALYIYDKRKLRSSAINRAQFTLAERFQIGQCVQLHATLAPTVILHVVCYAPSVLTLLFAYSGISLELETRWAMGQMTSVYKLAYALTHPLLTFARNVHLRKQVLATRPIARLLTLINPNRKITPVMTNNQGGRVVMERHFHVVEDMWVKAEKNRRDKK